MQAYGPVFARVYNHHWAGFARRVAPLIREFYEDTPIASANRMLLDLCCGTGQLALHFLDSGYRVTGLATVGDALSALGWTTVHFARAEALAVPLADPEREGRVFVVARK